MSFTIFQNEKTPFQAIKTRSSKSQKIDIFLKGLTHGFGPKMAIFPTIFLANIRQENVFYEILERKTSFQAIKTRRSKSQKIAVFLKGLSHGISPKMAIFPTFFLCNIGQKICLLRYSRTKKTPFQAIKTRSSKSRRIDVFPKGLTHGFGPKMAFFPNFLVRQYRPGKCLLRYSKTKNMPFWAIKTRTSKTQKIDVFPKGLTHGFV